MKKFKLNSRNIFLFTIVLTIISACTELKKEDKKEFILFSATVENANSDSLVITKGYEDKPIKVIYLKDDKSTIDTIFITPAYYRISDGTESTILYLKPNDSIHFYLNAEQFDESIVYAGRGVNESNYLAKKALHKESYGRFGNYMYYTRFNEEEFLRIADSLYQEDLAFLNNSKDKLNKEFISLEKENIKINYLMKLSDYESMHKYFTENDSFKVSGSFPNPYKNIEVNNERLLIIPEYRDYVNSYFQKQAYNMHLKNNNLDYYVTFLGLIDTALKSSLIKEELANYFANYYFMESKNSTECYILLKGMIKNPDYLKPIEKNYSKLKKIEKGEPSPSFELFDIDSNLVKLADFKGKLVYIDIWASWCAPCIAEIPSLMKLEEEYRDKDIVFVSINALDGYERWAETVKQNKLGGVQLYSPDEHLQFFKDYLVTGVPRFILLDEEGKIIDSDALRPSDEKLKKILNELLK